MRSPGSATIALAALLLSACSAGVPQQLASYGARSGQDAAIDQDIAATHNGGAATLDNLAGATAPWRLTQR